jgi:hypothetical protein
MALGGREGMLREDEEEGRGGRTLDQGEAICIL